MIVSLIFVITRNSTTNPAIAIPRATPVPPPASPTITGFNPHLSAVNLNLRTLHAKLQIMRSEAAKLASLSPAKLSSPSFRDEYIALGNEISNLRQTWGEGLSAVNDGVTATLRSASEESPTIVVKTTAELEENRSSSADGLGLGLLGPRLPASPPLSIASGDEVHGDGRGATTPQTEDREVFEAVALPMRRISLSRDQRIIKMQEERERLAKVREKRDTSTNMIRELQSVISLRPSAAARRSTAEHPPEI